MPSAAGVGTHEIGTVSTLNVDPGDGSLLTPEDAARFLKVSVSWVYEHVRPEAQDRLPVVKLGSISASTRAIYAPTSMQNGPNRRASAPAVDRARFGR
jgi:hypothetical protein